MPLSIFKKTAALLFGSAMLVPTTASAATISASQTIDLTTISNLSSFSAPLDGSVFLPAASFGTPANSFELTVDFKDNQALKITSGSLFSGLDTTSNRNGTISNATISFADFSTNGTLTGPTLNVGSKTLPSSTSFGPTFNINELGLGSALRFIEFSGFTLTYDIFNLPVGVFSLNSRLVTAGTAELTSTGALSVVPLPATLPLFGSGLALMGFAGWYRKRKVSAAA